MNFSEFLEKARPILQNVKLKEHAGSEGLCYKLKYTGNLPEEGLVIEKLEIAGAGALLKLLKLKLLLIIHVIMGLLYKL